MVTDQSISVLGTMGETTLLLIRPVNKLFTIARDQRKILGLRWVRLVTGKRKLKTGNRSRITEVPELRHLSCSDIKGTLSSPPIQESREP